MNRSIILRPLAGIVALAVGVGPALASVPPAARPARVTPHLAARPAHVTPQTRSIPAGLRGTLVALHRAQRIGDLAVANGSLFPLRFTSVAQEQRLRVGSRLTVSGDARHHVRLLVRTVRTNGVSARAHIRGLVARRLGRGTVEVLGVNGAAVVIHLGHAYVTRVHRPAALFARARASAVREPVIAPGEELDTAVTLSGAGAVASGTATVASPSPAQVEVEGLITAVNPAAGTLTIQDEDGLTTVVSVGAAAGTYHVGQEVEVAGVPTGAAGSAATVQAQAVTLEQPEAPATATTQPAPQLQVAAQPTAQPTEVSEAAEPTEVSEVAEPTEVSEAAEPTEVSEAAEPTEVPEAAQPTEAADAAEPTELKGLITAVNAAAGTITIQGDDDNGGASTVVSLGAAAGTYQVGQEVEVDGVPSGAGGNATTVHAQFVMLKDAAAPTDTTPAGTHVNVEGPITAVDPAAGTITIQGDDGPSTVVALSAAGGTYQVGQEVEVSGIVAGAGSTGATVQAQFIRLKSSGEGAGNGGDGDSGDGGN